jgi:hypothetical protein
MGRFLSLRDAPLVEFERGAPFSLFQSEPEQKADRIE